MKTYLSYLLLVGSLLLFSCTENDDSNLKYINVEPGTYIVGINLNTEIPLTKGVIYDDENNQFSFDNEYDYDYIYIHKRDENSEDKGVKIPVYAEINCDDGNTCKGFRYKICIDEEGNATITPLDSLCKELSKNGQLTLASGEEAYFSSWETQTWKGTSFEGGKVPHIEDSQLYQREENTNVELFRNGDANESESSFLSIADLTTGNGQLELKRVCTGFSFLAVFTDRSDGNDGTLYDTEFKEIMGDFPKNYYIKIYLGPSFTGEYNIATQSATVGNSGYYATGDGNGQYGNNDYVSLRENIASPKNGNGWGYSTFNGVDEEGKASNVLIAPINTTETLMAYIYVIHKKPNEELDEANALYLPITIGPVMENYFYRVGADIDIRELAAAFKEYEGEPADTRSTSAPRLFTPKSLVTHIEY